MNKLKELTWENHQRAERTAMARKLITGMTPVEYHEYLVNQYEIYFSLEKAASNILEQYPAMKRSNKILEDIEEIENVNNLLRGSSKICNTTKEYCNYVKTLDEQSLIAHIYVRHFGDMYGGQIIKNQNPSAGRMYDFDNVEELKVSFRELLNDDMAPEANRCFEFAMKLFEELNRE